MSDKYQAPDGTWISASAAQERIGRIAKALEHVNPSASSYCRRNWRLVAARPNTWKELHGLAVNAIIWFATSLPEALRSFRSCQEADHD